MFYSIFPLAATQPGVYYAFLSSDMMGRGIVCLLLLISMVTWTVMIDKALAVHRAKKLADAFWHRFESHNGRITAQNLVNDSKLFGGPNGDIYAAGVRQLNDFYENADQQAVLTDNPLWQRQNQVELSKAQLDAIEAVLDCEVSHQIEDLETRIGFLATMVSLSPFLGLFGTVWGVMMAFCGIAVAGKADFSALAPGVAGALLTTVAGLVVAIPSLVGYNLLTSSIRKLTISMDNFSERFMSRLKLEQVEVARRNRER